LNLTSNIGELVQSYDLCVFLTQNKQIDASSYLLGNKGNTNELNWLLAEQLKVYPKALHKLPHFVKHHCWFTSKSYEQASGEASAIFKSSLFMGTNMLDLSGGLGVDDWAFSPKFDNIISLDPNITLNILVRENFKKLGINNILRLDQTAEAYLLAPLAPQFDLIYLDADRRPNESRNFFLDQGTPNFLAIQNTCLKLGKKVLLKLSPMVDISYLKKVLLGIEKILVIGNKLEVKELLVVLSRNYVGETIEEAVILKEAGPNLFFSPDSAALPATKTSSKALYFFEPHPSIIKAGLVSSYANHCGLNLLAPQSAFYTGEIIPANFMGRAFELVQAFEFTKSNLQQYLKNNGLVQANITKRNFKQSTDEIRKAFKIKEGGKDYLFFSTLSNDVRMVYHCQKANT
jgi:hypothetical protein